MAPKGLGKGRVGMYTAAASSNSGSEPFDLLGFSHNLYAKCFFEIIIAFTLFYIAQGNIGVFCDMKQLFRLFFRHGIKGKGFGSITNSITVASGLSLKEVLKTYISRKSPTPLSVVLIASSISARGARPFFVFLTVIVAEVYASTPSYLWQSRHFMPSS